MPDDTQNPEKKLLIDEDWKSQVEAEKDAARHADGTAKPVESASSTGAPGPLPPANLSFLVGTLYLQGAIALGLMPNPMTQKADVRLDQAKHAIDLLAVLQQKTEGNRTPDESDELESVLYELRMTFVTVSERVGTKS